MVTDTLLKQPPKQLLRLDKGSHLVVHRLYDHDRAYILQTADGRVVFTIPFERDFTLIGTTDQAYSGDPAVAVPTAEEISYLCGAVNEYFRTVVSAANAVWAFAGVRALYGDGHRKPQDVGRDYTLVLDRGFRKAPLLTVYGGKLTTYRRLAEDALGQVARFFGRARSQPWTARSPLPGGDFAFDRTPELIERTRQRWPFLTDDHLRRLVGAYGTRVERILHRATRLDDLGMRFGADLTAAEVRYLMTTEWAQTADDVLWRRSKLGLRFTDAQRAMLDRFMAQTDG
jgi:glycerol-3-phosphate dehydrogenase